jgi:hypothetical protein
MINGKLQGKMVKWQNESFQQPVPEIVHLIKDDPKCLKLWVKRENAREESIYTYMPVTQNILNGNIRHRMFKICSK